VSQLRTSLLPSVDRQERSASPCRNRSSPAPMRSSNVEDLLAGRGLDISYETVRSRVLKIFLFIIPGMARTSTASPTEVLAGLVDRATF